VISRHPGAGGQARQVEVTAAERSPTCTDVVAEMLLDPAFGIMGSQMKIQVADDVVWSQVGEDIVILNVASGYYFGLGGVAARVWSFIVAQTATDEILTNIILEYEVEADRARNELQALVDDLVRERLVVMN